MSRISMQAPWVTYHSMIEKLFELDDQVFIGELGKWDGGNSDYEFDIVVTDNTDKYLAMTQVMPRSVQFGNVTLKINIRNGMDDERDYSVEAFKRLFNGNRSVRDIREVEDQTGGKHSYVRFEPEVVQFYNDDLTDYNGNWSGLMQDIARELFETNSLEISFCTADVRENSEAN